MWGVKVELYWTISYFSFYFFLAIWRNNDRSDTTFKPALKVFLVLPKNAPTLWGMSTWSSSVSCGTRVVPITCDRMLDTLLIVVTFLRLFLDGFCRGAGHIGLLGGDSAAVTFSVMWMLHMNARTSGFPLNHCTLIILWAVPMLCLIGL